MPREWPPVSVWLGVLALVGSPAALFLYALGNGGGPLGQTGLAGLLCGTVIVVGLLRRSASAVDIGTAYACAVGFAGCLLTIGRLAVEPAAWTAVPAYLLAAGWAGGVGVTLNWPETRRWCGLLPPRESEGEA